MCVLFEKWWKNINFKIYKFILLIKVALIFNWKLIINLGKTNDIVPVYFVIFSFIYKALNNVHKVCK